MKMEDGNGALQKYTTLRSISDEGLRDYLKSTFSDMFSGNQIDISKRFGNTQKTTGISVGLYASLKSVSSFEGIQYIINHPYWEGQSVNIQMGEKMAVPHLKIGKTTPMVILVNLDASEGIDISEAESLFWIHMNGIDGIESIDLSGSPIWGQRAVAVEGDVFTGSKLVAVDCPSLKEIKLPVRDKLYAWSIDVECLPALESIDLSSIQMLFQLYVGDLSAQCKITYPNLTARHTYVGNFAPTYFVCSQSQSYKFWA